MARRGRRMGARITGWILVGVAAMLATVVGGSARAEGGAVVEIEPVPPATVQALAVLGTTQGGTLVQLSARDVPRGTTGAVHPGTCATLDPAPVGLLGDITEGGPQQLSLPVPLEALQGEPHAIVLHEGLDLDTVLACGDVPGDGETADTGDANEPIAYEVTMTGRIVRLPPFGIDFDARQMPPEDVGEVIASFERQGSLVLSEIDTPRGDTVERAPELALDVGDFVQEIMDPRPGTLQLVTNFAMWEHTRNGPKDMAEFPTDIFEQEFSEGGTLAWSFDQERTALAPAISVESIPNLFISHDRVDRSLRIVRFGVAALERDGDRIAGSVDLIGWAATGAVVVPDPDDLAFYRYIGSFTGRASP